MKNFLGLLLLSFFLIIDTGQSKGESIDCDSKKQEYLCISLGL